MNLAELFVAAQAAPSRASARGPPFVCVDYPQRRAGASTAGSAGTFVAIVIRMESRGAGRLLDCALLPLRIARPRRALATASASLVGSFGVFPGVDRPAVLFAVDSTAERYARAMLLPASTRGGATLRRALAAWCGCDPSIGGLLVVGRKP